MAKSAKRKTDDTGVTKADRASRVLTQGGLSVSERDIARRAYDLYLARGRESGHEMEDWLQAERQLRVPVSSTA